MSYEIIECLKSTLSTDTNTRISAELRLEEILMMPAAIASRKFVREHWSPYFPSFKGHAPSFDVKTQIRAAILQGLCDSSSKLRSTFAHVLSILASCDWPDDCPELLSQLISLISSSSPNCVHGAMQVFVEFVKADVTEDQLLPLLRDLLPVLMDVVKSSQIHSPITRSRSVKVFSQCLECLFMVKDQYPQAVQEATSSFLPSWIGSLLSNLQEDAVYAIVDTGNWDSLALRFQTYETMNILHRAFPAAIASYQNDLLDITLHQLRTFIPAFTQFFVNEGAVPPEVGELDSSITLPDLAVAMLDFINYCIRSGRGKGWLKHEAHVESLVQTILQWSQIIADEEDTWESDPEAFLLNEDDDGDTVGPRPAGYDLLNTLFERLPDAVVVSLEQCLTTVLESAERCRQERIRGWWKPLEATLGCYSSVAEDVSEHLSRAITGKNTSRFISLLTKSLPSLMGDQDCILLQARGLITASKFARLLPTSVVEGYLITAMEIVEANSVPLPLKLSAVKSIRNFCESSDFAMVASQANRIAKALGLLLLMAKEGPLCVLLETLSMLLRVDQGKWLTIDLASSLASAFLEVWHGNQRDPVISAVLEDAFESLGGNSVANVYTSILSTALPILCQSITSAPPDSPWIQTSAFDFITQLMQKRNEVRSLQVIPTVCGPLFECLQRSSDRDVLQAGVNCLILLIRCDISQVLNWTQAGGSSGLECVLNLIARLLNPSEDESGGLLVGDLIIRLLGGASDVISPVLPPLLMAMITRISTAKTVTFLQSLIVPFTLLLQTQQNATIEFLESTSVNQGDRTKTALAVLVETWCENASTIAGLWPSRMSILAMCQLFLTERPSVQQIMVQGDMLLDLETKDVIVTRSRARKTPHRFSTVPFPVKALKLILAELQTDLDNGPAAAINKEHLDIASDDEDDEWEDEDKLIQGFKPDEFAYLSEMLQSKGGNLDTDDELNIDDEDYDEFPVLGINMKEHIISFLKSCRARNVNNFSSIVDQLTKEEELILKRALSLGEPGQEGYI